MQGSMKVAASYARAAVTVVLYLRRKELRQTAQGELLKHMTAVESSTDGIATFAADRRPRPSCRRHGAPAPCRDPARLAAERGHRRPVRLRRVPGDHPPDLCRGGLSIAEKIRKAAERTEVRLESGKRVSISLSIGVASLAAPPENMDDLISRVDAALYTSKNSGRNKVTLAP